MMCNRDSRRKDLSSSCWRSLRKVCGETVTYRTDMTNSRPTWVTFLCGEDERTLLQCVAAGGYRLDRYQIQDIVSVRGEHPPTELRRGCVVLRVERQVESVPLESLFETRCSSTVVFHGVTEELHYTSAVQR